MWGYVYLVLVQDAELGEMRVLIDTGSGFGASDRHLQAGLEQLLVSPDSLTHILITHGHIDHFGGLSSLRPLTSARLGVHELDQRILTHYEERLVFVTHRLDGFLAEAGVRTERRAKIIEMYRLTKSLFHSVKVDFTYEAAGMRVGPFHLLHVPGHCAGHVVIRLHDILFSGDHVLDHTSPHQSPEQLTLSTGLEHYLASLEALRLWTSPSTGAPVRLTLGGHENPITDLAVRIGEIRDLHHLRLEKVLSILSEPNTVAGVSQGLFGQVHGYNVLLALEEAGAHVEYLYQRGHLGIDNLQEVEASSLPVPIRYRRLS
jgi:glyoxylase-like metal-dependent hydrolase (beta-lactamase superfamily II)